MEEQEKQTEYMRGVPPHDETAEQAVLCSMFLDREAASVALEVLRGEDFYRPDHRMVFEAAEELTNCQRPLRAQTAQGERSSLASSEEIAAGAKLEFSILVMSDDLVPAVKEWLSYGKLRGLGQWRNSGKGRFLCEILEERAADIADILE